MTEQYTIIFFFVLKATGWKDKTAMKSKIEEVLDHVGIENKIF